MKNGGPWYVAADSRKDGGRHLLVDRSKCKDAWWTEEDLDIAIAYRHLEAAKAQVRKLKHGDPHVVDANEAARICSENARDNMHEEALDGMQSPHGQD